eukprot:40395-Chlamydomonas_euryale.AAC.1
MFSPSSASAPESSPPFLSHHNTRRELGTCVGSPGKATIRVGASASSTHRALGQAKRDSAQDRSPACGEAKRGDTGAQGHHPLACWPTRAGQKQAHLHALERVAANADHLSPDARVMRENPNEERQGGLQRRTTLLEAALGVGFRHLRRCR